MNLNHVACGGFEGICRSSSLFGMFGASAMGRSKPKAALGSHHGLKRVLASGGI